MLDLPTPQPSTIAERGGLPEPRAARWKRAAHYYRRMRNHWRDAAADRAGSREAIISQQANRISELNAARRRALSHALRYRGYSRADADALREYRECALANARRVVELEAAIGAALWDEISKDYRRAFRRLWETGVEPRRPEDA